MKIITLSLFVLLILLSYAWADGVEVNLIKGNTVIPVQNNHVRMVSEEVKMFENKEVRRIPHSFLPFVTNKKEFYKGMKVVAFFLFENLTNSSIDMKMGFPLDGGDEPSDFRVLIQETPVKVERRLMGSIDESELKDSGGFTREMYVWNISFSDRERKAVKVEYIGQWSSEPRTYPEQDFIYITKTGALWNGKIEKADFYMTLPEDVVRVLAEKTSKFKLNIQPQGYTIKDNKIEWHFVNWKPIEDIKVSVVEELPTESEVIQHISQLFKNKDYDGNQRRYAQEEDLEVWKSKCRLNFDIERRFYIKALRNEIYARHGRIFTTPDMRRIFESAPWYKPRADFKEIDLNEIEKKNIEFIFEYEKRMGWK